MSSPEETIPPTPTPLEEEIGKDDVLSKILEFAELSEKDKSKILRKITKDPNAKTPAYYHRKYAEQLIPDLEKFITAPQNTVLFYAMEDYPGWRPNTLKMYVVNGFAYVVDNLDPEGKFKQLRESVEIRVRPDGIRLFKTRPVGPPPVLKGRWITVEDCDSAIVPAEHLAEDPLTVEVKAWLKTAKTKGATFKRPQSQEEFTLTESQVTKWNEFFETLQEFGGIATKNSLLVRRIM